MCGGPIIRQLRLSNSWGDSAESRRVPSAFRKLLIGGFALLALTAFWCDDDDDPPPFNPNPVQTGSGQVTCLNEPFDGQLVRSLPLRVAGEQNLDFDMHITVDGVEAVRVNEPNPVVDPSGTGGCDTFWDRGFDENIGALQPGMREVDAVAVAPRGFSRSATVYYDPDGTDPFVVFFDPAEIEVAAGTEEYACYHLFEPTDTSSYRFTTASPNAIVVKSTVGSRTWWSGRTYRDRVCGFEVIVAPDVNPGRYPIDMTVTSQSQDGNPAVTATVTIIVTNDGTASSSSSSPSGAPPPPPIDISGTWDLHIDITDACDPEPAYDATLTITQTGTSIKVIGLGDGNEAWEGTIVGDQVTFGGDRAEDKGVTTATFIMTVDASGEKMSGIEDWSWTDGSLSCPQGFSDVDGTKTG